MKPSYLKYIYIIFVFLLITGCTKAPDSHLNVNQQLASPYTLPAHTYLAMAKNESGEKQQSMQIMAAGRLIYDGQWQKARVIIARIKPLSPVIADEKKLLLAKIALIGERPEAGKKNLASIQDIKSLSIYHQAQFYEMLAQAYKDTDNATDSVSERIKLNNLLPESAAKASNLRALWLSLTSLPIIDLNTMAIEANNDSELQGWVNLAIISRDKDNLPQNMLQKIALWQKEYPRHAANS
jgi:outer membrane PBP1 activator LpoA protein